MDAKQLSMPSKIQAKRRLADETSSENDSLLAASSVGQAYSDGAVGGVDRLAARSVVEAARQLDGRPALGTRSARRSPSAPKTFKVVAQRYLTSLAMLDAVV